MVIRMERKKNGFKQHTWGAKKGEKGPTASRVARLRENVSRRSLATTTGKGTPRGALVEVMGPMD